MVSVKAFDVAQEAVEEYRILTAKHFRNGAGIEKFACKWCKENGKQFLRVVKVVENIHIYEMPLDEFIAHAKLVTEND